ncbi:mucin TcMUCII [Trypanosoma cruzi cruzi]|nr:mucin TcMUCII [Trypanosoma cruzi cruzi]
MMTCRLLCALLVLALCCCPSVCVKTTGGLTKNMDLSSTQSQVQDQSDEEQVSETEIVAEPEGEADVDEGSGSEDSTLRKTQGSSDEVKTPGEDAGAGQRLTGTPGLQSDTNNLQTSQIRKPKIPQRRPRRPPLRQRHQVLRPRGRQLRRPPAHRHVFANRRQPQQLCVGVCPLLLAASAAGVHRLG